MIDLKQKTKFYLSLGFFYLTIIFVFNNTSFFIVFAIFFLMQIFWAKTSSLIETLWYTLLISLPFDFGKQLFLPSLMPRPIISFKFSDWAFLSMTTKTVVIITPFLVIGLLLIVKMRQQNKKENYINKESLMWLVLLFISLLSCLVSSNKVLAVYQWLSLLVSVSLFFTAGIFFKNKEIRRKSFTIILSILLFQGILSLGEYLKKGPIGFFIEKGAYIIASGNITETALGHNIFRSYGSFSGPNRMAAFLSMCLVIASLGLFKNTYIKKNLFTWLALVFGLIGVILSFSRTSWFFLMIFSFILIFTLIRQKYQLYKDIKKIGLVILLLLMVSFPFVYARIASLNTAFSYYGTGSVRLKLIIEALHLIRLKPFLGVGLNHFTMAITRWPVTDVRNYFLAPVHNIYLLIAAETGVFSLLVFITGVYFILRQAKSKSGVLLKQEKSLYSGLKIAVLLYLSIAFFEPFFADPVFNLFMIFLAALTTLNVKRN
jgi:putative inorganic carbon (hco3(-)) transporter